MKNKAVCLILAFCFVVSLLTGSSIQTSATQNKTNNKKTIRVGCIISTGYHRKTKEGQITGYGYSYEQILAQYAGWNIEYVEGTWTELLNKLDHGEIDLLGFLMHTTEREKKYAFSNLPAGSSMSSLVTRKKNKKYTYQGYQSFNGITVACQRNNANIESFLEYAKKHQFKVKLHFCDTYKDVFQAIKSGKVDAGLVTNFQDLSSYNIID